MSSYDPLSWTPIAPCRSRRSPDVCGLYAIIHLASGRIYGGSSLRVADRLAHHFAALRKGAHWNPKLQHAWNKYGPDAFVSKLVAVVPQERLAWEEKRLLDELFARGGQFNICPHPYAPFRGRQHMDAWKQELSRRMMGKPVAPGHKRTPEERHRRSVALSKALTGKPLSEEHRAALRRGWEKRRKWWKASDETRAKISAAGRGRKMSPENRAKLSAANLGRPLSEKHRAKLRAAWVRRRTQRT